MGSLREASGPGCEAAGGLGGRSPLAGAKLPEGVLGERISPARDTSEPVMMLAVGDR